MLTKLLSPTRNFWYTIIITRTFDWEVFKYQWWVRSIMTCEKVTYNGNNTILLSLTNNIMTREKVIICVITWLTRNTKSITPLYESFSPLQESYLATTANAFAMVTNIEGLDIWFCGTQCQENIPHFQPLRKEWGVGLQSKYIYHDHILWGLYILLDSRETQKGVYHYDIRFVYIGSL